MSERVLVVGSGAREHAIAAALERSRQRAEVICFGSSRNPGIADFCKSYRVGDCNDPATVSEWAVTQGATMAVIGPEAPLAAGVADALWAAGVLTVGPTKALARIESSKGFARDLMAKYGIAGNPRFARFDGDSLMEAEHLLRSLPMRHVIKDDGLAGGKGVKVCGDHLRSHADSVACCRELAESGHPFVIEEKLEGEEFSLLSFTDGKTLRHMPAVQDHKRAYVGDTGPNTGGMGTYSDADGLLPFLRAGDVAAAQRINEQVVAALKTECGEPYRGVLYGGFMATAAGVNVIEFNARFGDPECLNLLTLLESDFVAVCQGIVRGTLDDIEVQFSPHATVCKYVVPEGYPGTTCKGTAVVLRDAEVDECVTTYLGSVDADHGKLLAQGSRTLAFVAVAETIAEAETLCEAAAASVEGPFFHREDIGTAASLERRVLHMNEVRGGGLA